MEEEKDVSCSFVLNGECHYQENGDVNFDLPPVFYDYGDETFELEGQQDYSCPSPLVLDHHLHKGIACVAHFAPCYDNFIVPLSLQLEPELAELITMGGQMGSTSEGQPRGIDKEGKHGEPLIFKEGCHENHEVNYDLPPIFDELEIEEL